MRKGSRFLGPVLNWAAVLALGMGWEAAIAGGLDAQPASTALHLAARTGDVTLLRQRLDAGDAVDARDERDMTPLHYAAEMGRLDAAGLLLDRGADPNARAMGGMTPLHFAAMLAHPEMVGLLMRRGSRADLPNTSGMMPLHLAANDQVVNVLVAAGADVNARTPKGMTPLHTARQGLVARALIANKADPRVRDHRGRTAMETAGIETLERVGLSIHSTMLGRLRGIIGQMPLTVTNVSTEPTLDLSVLAKSPGCAIDVTPASFPRLLPGQDAKFVLTFTRLPTARGGEYPIYVSIRGNGRRLGDTDLKVDTTMGLRPEDTGAIRLAKGQIRPASSRWSYLIYGSAPLLVVAAWLFFRRR